MGKKEKHKIERQDFSESSTASFDWNPKDYLVPLLFVLFIAVYVFSGGGVTFHVKTFKAFTGTMGVDLLAIALMISLMYQGSGKLRFPLLLVLFIGYCATAIFPNFIRGLGYDTESYFGLMIGYLLLMIVTVNSLDSRGLKNTFLLLTLLNFIISILCYLEYYAILQWNGMLSHHQTVILTFGNQNYLGNYLVMMIPIALSLSVIKFPLAIRLFGIITAISLYACCVLTSSRNAFGLGLLQMVLFGLLLGLIHGFDEAKRILRKKWVWSLLLGLAVTICFVIFQNERLLERLSRSLSFQGLLGPRHLAVKAAWDLFLRDGFSMVFGNGLGSYYRLIFTNYDADFRFYGTERSFKHVHNEYLEHLCDGGLVNFLLFLLIIGVTVYGLVKRLREKDKLKDDSAIIIALICSIFGFCGYGVFDIATKMVSTQFTYYFILGCSWVLITKWNFRTHRIVVFSILVATFLGSTFLTTRNFLSEYYHFEAVKYGYKSMIKKQANTLSALQNEENPKKIQALKVQSVKLRDRFSEMEDVFASALYWNNRNVYAHYDLLIYYFMRGMFDEFEKKYAEIDAIIPSYRNIQEIKALSYIHRGRLDDALESLKSYLSYDSYNESGMFGLFALQVIRKRYDEALDELENIVVKHLKMAEYQKTSFGQEFPYTYTIERSANDRIVTLTPLKPELGGVRRASIMKIFDSFDEEMRKSFYVVRNDIKEKLGFFFWDDLGLKEYAIDNFLKWAVTKRGKAIKERYYSRIFDNYFSEYKKDPDNKKAISNLLTIVHQARQRFANTSDYNRFRATLYRKLGDYKRFFRFNPRS